MTNSNNKQVEPELKACPLCGSANLFLRDIAGWELDCRNCELSLVLADDPSREGLIARWNTRVPVASTAPGLGEIANLLNEVDKTARLLLREGRTATDIDFAVEYIVSRVVALRRAIDTAYADGYDNGFRQGKQSRVSPAPKEEEATTPPIGYERAITIEWNNELIEAKRLRVLSETESTELNELQWLAGIKRELQSGPCPAPLVSDCDRDV